MLSLGSHLSCLSNASVVHSLVDSFFEGKKALVKERLMDSVRVIVDGLFEEMVGQVKEMMLPPKESSGSSGGSGDQVKPSSKATTPAKPSTSVPPVSHPPKMVFAVKSKPGPSSIVDPPFSSLYKRMADEDGSSSCSKNIQPNKKKAITVEMECDHPLDDDEVAFDEAASGDHELASRSAHLSFDTPSTSKEQQRAIILSGKTFSCTEPNCGKHFKSGADLKRHLRTHSKAKPFGCTFSGCSLEFSRRDNAIAHIRSVHLKKIKPEEADKEGGGGEEGDNSNDPPPDPATYLSVKEDLL